MPNIPKFDEGEVPDWILEEKVRLTPVFCADPDIIYQIIILVERVDAPGAVTLEFRESDVLINGKFLDLGEETMSYVSLADEVNEYRLGVSIESEPYKEE